MPGFAVHVVRASSIACASMILAGAPLLPARADAQTASLTGEWLIDRSASEFPREIGFTPTWMAGANRGGSAGSGGGRGRRGGGGSPGGAEPIPPRPESYDESKIVELLTAEVRVPAVRLTVVDTPAAVTVTNEQGQSRTFHPDGRDEPLPLDDVRVTINASRSGERLNVVYRVSREREIRYSYTRAESPPRLVVEAQLFERGRAGDRATRVYQPGPDSVEASAPAPSRTRADAPAPPAAVAPASSSAAPSETLDQRPGAELKGLKRLGVLVEELDARANACGLNHDAIEAALAERLAAAGFSVRRNSDEDTYVYVNIITNALPGGACVSRYDAFLYSYASARLSYRDQSVLAQVSLAHRGGLGSSPAQGHGAAVLQALEGYVDTFVQQIHDANR